MAYMSHIDTLFVVVQARYSSVRLPGKVLMPFLDSTILGCTVHSAQEAVGKEQVVLATSNEPSDDPVAEYCEQNGMRVFRGSLNNVAQRFASLIDQLGATHIIRLSADSPLIDYRLIQRAITEYENSPAQLVTNVAERSFPKGQSVELFEVAAFEKLLSSTNDPDDLEHVTRFFYRNQDLFTVKNFRASNDYSGLQMSVDTQEDYVRLTGFADWLRDELPQLGAEQRALKLQEYITLQKGTVDNA